MFLVFSDAPIGLIMMSLSPRSEVIVQSHLKMAKVVFLETSLDLWHGLY